MTPGAAMITGAAGDIGSAIARRLGSGRLFLVDHPSAREPLERLAEECADNGGTVSTTCFDITDRSAIARALELCDQTLGGLAALVNCAGVQGEFLPVQAHGSDSARRVIDVNLIAVFEATAAVARSMIARDLSGSIVNIASMAGVNGAPNMPAYSAAKAGVIGLTKSAAKDLAPHGIRVNAVSPGFVGPGRMWDTQIRAQAATPSYQYADDPAEVERQMIASIPLGRYGGPDEVAGVTAFLLSSAASYVTGVNIEVSGGSM